MLSRKSAKIAPAVNEGAPSATDDKSAAPAAPDERDAIIQRLQRDLAEERQRSAALRENVDNLSFKSDTLEKSYAKQLADTRQRLAAAEQVVAEHKANASTFGASHEETVRLLKDARAELEQVKLDRDQLKRQLARGSHSLDRTPLTVGAGDAHVDEGTINQLMANPGWSTKKEAAAAGSHLEARVATEQESAPEVMIAPELVFTKDRDKEDAE